MQADGSTATAQLGEQWSARLKALLSSTFLLLTSGCASYFLHTGDGPPYGIYPGTRAELSTLAHVCENPRAAVLLLDLPGSAALDTMVLPADILVAIGLGDGAGFWPPLPQHTNAPGNRVPVPERKPALHQ